MDKKNVPAALALLVSTLLTGCAANSLQYDHGVRVVNLPGAESSGQALVLGQVPPGTAMTLDALKKAGVPVLAWGNFLTVAVNFVILAFVIFLMVKQINRLKREEPAAAPAPAVTPEDIVLLREIRDSLRK